MELSLGVKHTYFTSMLQLLTLSTCQHYNIAYNNILYITETLVRKMVCLPFVFTSLHQKAIPRYDSALLIL